MNTELTKYTVRVQLGAGMPFGLANTVLAATMEDAARIRFDKLPDEGYRKSCSAMLVEENTGALVSRAYVLPVVKTVSFGKAI